ncbi:unnamed protein product [Pseudo-nitzschia multistriata]|uniref:Uncharacterized protein n=1 Tax=Pseudo-nitzschia multistriata TaxID=183589 RepID=A0A448ZR13_9STRA|nr:unnamed protein product [Pseudo-nitzschia multistriata]
MSDSAALVPAGRKIGRRGVRGAKGAFRDQTEPSGRRAPHTRRVPSVAMATAMALLPLALVCLPDPARAFAAHGGRPPPLLALRAVPGDGPGEDDQRKNGAWTPNDFLEGFFRAGPPQEPLGCGPAGAESSSNANGSNDIGNYYGSDNNLDCDDDGYGDELPAGTSLLVRIPAKQLKPGGLRLFLMFYLMGMQNTPDQNTWRADQKLMSVNVTPKTLPEGVGGTETEDEPTERRYVLEMLYDRDRTGMLQIELLPHRTGPSGGVRPAEVRIYRCGSRPSTSYLMQESVVVDGVLEELQNLSGGGSDGEPGGDGSEPEIAEEDRLLIPDPEHAIADARESLAFG